MVQDLTRRGRYLPPAMVRTNPYDPAAPLVVTYAAHLAVDRYYIRWSNRTAPCNPIKRHDMYFTFDDHGGIDGTPSASSNAWTSPVNRSSTPLSSTPTCG
ncbi:hypothetical protein GCM10023169_26690 [Georgenia halophila]|uniref:Uncharacterized protein n=1 Tax=Georgenia halophila TaxID=620889 RepID=A0ABP8LCI7_9MICO